jgi:hypothetical protein
MGSSFLKQRLNMEKFTPNFSQNFSAEFVPEILQGFTTQPIATT